MPCGWQASASNSSFHLTKRLHSSFNTITPYSIGHCAAYLQLHRSIHSKMVRLSRSVLGEYST